MQKTIIESKSSDESGIEKNLKEHLNIQFSAQKDEFRQFTMDQTEALARIIDETVAKPIQSLQSELAELRAKLGKIL